MLQKTSASILDRKERKINGFFKKIRSELILLKNIAERRMKLFGHVVRIGDLERQLI